MISGMKEMDSPSDYWNTSTEFPELKASHSVIQRNGQTLFDHTMRVIDLLTKKTPITLMSGLFHDLGKCYCKSENVLLFPCHAEKSADIAKARLTEWGATPFIIDRVTRIVSTHMYDIIGVTQEKTIRKFIADVGQDNIENWFAVRIADSMSYSRYNQYQQHIIDPFYKAVQQYLSKLPRQNDLPQLISEPNIIMGGKERKCDDVSLSTEGG